MSTSAILPTSAAIGAAFAATFTDIALATEALPYEIPGVAKFGYLPPAEHATEQMTPLLVLDGSPRPDVMPDFPDIVMLHDILDTKWSALTKGVDVDRIGVDGIAPRDVRLFSSMLKDKTPRELIAGHDGAWLLHGYAEILFQAAYQTSGDQLSSVLFVAGALEACSGSFGPDTGMNLRRGLNAFRSEKRLKAFIEGAEETMPPVPTPGWDFGAAAAIAGEAYADAVRRNKGPSQFYNSLRAGAATAWNKYILFNGKKYPGKVESVLNRAFNGEQVEPAGGGLSGYFTHNNEAKPFEERVRNVVRAAWASLMTISEVYPDGDDPVSGVNWDDVQRNMMEVSELLGGDNPDIPKDEFDSSFPGVDKAELANKATELANEAFEIGAEKYEKMRELDDMEGDYEEDDEIES